MAINTHEVKCYIYECYDKRCNRREQVSKEDTEARDGKICDRCGEHMRVIKAITIYDTVFSISLSNKQHEELKGFSEAEEQEREEKSKRVRELDVMCQGLLKSMRQTKERVDKVIDTSNKSLSLLETLARTKPEAEKTIEALADIVKQSDKEASTRFKSYNEKKAKFLDKFIEMVELKRELSRDE